MSSPHLPRSRRDRTIPGPVLLLSVILFAALTFSTGWVAGATHERSIPTTIMPCSAWADTATPVIPAHTLTGACLEPGGYVSTPTHP
jgi:hypothetical protein